ncbi:hypothetical protein CEXT_122811 [Caerostris extrusa]|uniref:Uncharacterized protein n=1 Tax=Caerostris extrusa TaxID=172846 RepID=A0AAV4MVT2_CAEEX|nr:hypothetical protein CEXT_122811 [Caerostris extrusa]
MTEETKCSAQRRAAAQSDAFFVGFLGRRLIKGIVNADFDKDTNPLRIFCHLQIGHFSGKSVQGYLQYHILFGCKPIMLFLYTVAAFGREDNPSPFCFAN